MKQAQPMSWLARGLAVLLLAAALAQAKKIGTLDATAPLPPRYDFSRYFGAHGGGGDPGGGIGGGLGTDKASAAASDRDTSAGFVEPVDFKSFFGGGGGGGFGTQRQAASPFFGASSLSANKQQSRLPFGSSPFSALAAASSAESDDFGDFSKAKRGAAGHAGHAQEQQSDDDFFHFDFGEGGGTKADLQDDDGEDRDEAEEDDGDTAGHSRPLKQAGNARYPSYSSYYHTQPEQLRAAAGTNAEAQDDDDFGFDEEEGAGAGASSADIRAPSRTPLASSAEAYDSRPFRDASQHTADPVTAGKGLGPARFNLQSGFVPSPVDPLRTQASQHQAAQAAQASKAASHAAVHAAVRAAHRAAASHGKAGAAPGTGLGLGLGSNPLAAADVAGLGPVARSFVRRTREEPDDAFFEAYSDGDEKEGDDYRFGPEFFGGEDDDDEAPRGKQQAEADDDGDGEAQQSAAATPGSCKKVKKKGSVCMVCADPKTGGNYEQCQYATEPETQSYSFGRSSSYGNPRGGKSRRRRRREEDRQQQEAQDSSLQDTSQDTSQDAPAGSQRQQDAAGEAGEALEGLETGLDSDSHEEDHAKIQAELDRSLEQLQGPKYEDYFSFLFPELAKEKEQAKATKGKKKGKKERKGNKAKKGKKKADEEQDSEEVSSLLSRLEDDDEDPFAAETTSAVGAGPGPGADLWLGPPESAGPPGSVGVVPKKDLERMLGEFQQKDRSDCTKVEKDKMTCYQCVDKKGMQHEECMFVAASEPKQSHLAYHQSSAFKQPGPPPKAGAGTAAKATNASASTTAAPPRTATARAAASNDAPSAVAAPAKAPAKATAGSKGQAKSRQQRAAERAEAEDEDDEKEDLQDDDEEVVEPEGLGQGPDDGMFTEETKAVYDRTLKMSLPKYMLDRSENERVFDEVLAAGV